MTHEAFMLPSRPPEPSDAAAVELERQLTLWRSPRMRELLRIAEQAAADVTLLIRGETGTGKDLVARAIHHLSSRRDRRFIQGELRATARVPRVLCREHEAAEVALRRAWKAALRAWMRERRPP